MGRLAAQRWSRFRPISSGEDYRNSRRGGAIRLVLFGEEEPNPVDNALLRPSMNALRQTDDLALEGIHFRLSEEAVPQVP
mgnify:CR=1 FL=1